MRLKNHNLNKQGVRYYLTALSEVNWFVVGIISLIAATGLAMMFSAGGGEDTVYFFQQLTRFGFAFIIMLIIAVIPMHLLIDYAYLVYFACLFVLVVVDIVGHIGMGAQRWVKLGGLSLQPSEFMKLAVILVLARYFHKLHHEDIKRTVFLLPPLLIIAIPAFFILRQPNLGTTTILAGVGIIMCFLAGVQWRYFIGAAVSGLAALPVLWSFMHDYQKRRVLTFLDPEQDPLGAGYNILQSMIAIGSGGFIGKGYLQGSQSQLNFLPEKHTDFVFTMLAEEFGFMGSVFLLLLYLTFLGTGILLTIKSRSVFGALIAGGVVAMFFIHIFINCGMVMGMLPVVGVPLPLMSYGGSIMVSSMCAIGLLLNAYVNRNNAPNNSKLRP